MEIEDEQYENPMEKDISLWKWLLFICYIGVMLIIEEVVFWTIKRWR